MGGVANTHWMCRFLLLAARSHRSGSASIVQQCIRAGLLDEIHIDLVPVLLGGGVSLFDHLGTGPIDLERTRVIEGAGVTHLTFRVLK